MNTRKQVLIMSGLLMLMLITVGIYGAWYPSRETASRIELDERAAERGSILFARNCRLCHGDVGEGGALGARLPAAPALDRSDLQGFADSKAILSVDIDENAVTLTVSEEDRFQSGHLILIGEERMEVTSVAGAVITVKRGIGHTDAQSHRGETAILLFAEANLTEQIDIITNTLVCGRVGTAMPAWAQGQGGPLSDEQIRQLMIVITQGRWDLVEEEVDVEDHLTALVDPLTGDTDTLTVDDITLFKGTEETALRIGEERLLINTVVDSDEANTDPHSGTLIVQRGVLGTTPFEHSAGDIIYRFPLSPEPSINENSCGQTARPAAPAGVPELIEPFAGQEVEISARNIEFNIDEILLEAGGQVRLRLDNQDTGVDHNIAVYESSTSIVPVASGSVGLIFPGPAVDDTAFDVPEAGTYFFRCDVHPTTMIGELIVE